MEKKEEKQSDIEESDVDTGSVKRIHTSVKVTSDCDTGVSEKIPISVHDETLSTKLGSGCSYSSPSASPPRKILISALKQRVADEERAQKVMLAHEIAFNDAFKLKHASETPENDDKLTNDKYRRLKQNVKEIVHKAFWDRLRWDIEKDPPDYGHTFVLIQEIKEILLSLLPHNRVTSFHKRIEEYMDLDFFKQQAENDIIDMKSIATFIIDLMSSICAPIRDDQVSALRSIDDIVDLFRETYKVLELMKVDFANFSISCVRPHMKQNQFEYERSEFAKLLKNSPDGLKNVRKWICSAYDLSLKQLEEIYDVMKKDRVSGKLSSNDELESRYAKIRHATLSPLSVLKTAYTRILSSDMDLEFLPETLQLDRNRIDVLRQLVDQIVFVSAIMLTSCGVYGQPIASHKEFLDKLKRSLMVLTTPPLIKTLPKLLDSLSLQSWKEAIEYAAGRGPEVARCVNASKETILKDQISSMKEKLHSHPIYSVLYKRTVQYLKNAADMLSQYTATTPPTLAPPPTGLSFLAPELASLAMQYSKLVNLNQTVYGPFYVPILKDVLGLVSTPSEQTKSCSDSTSAKKNLDWNKAEVQESSTSTISADVKGKYKVTGSLEDLD